MKVLITNGSKPDTWYYGKQGQVFEVTEVTDFSYRVPDQGDYGVYGVMKNDGELLYTEAEYNDLENHYMKEIDNLREEKAILLQQIEQEVDRQRVAIPHKVAEAIEEIRKHDIRWLGYHSNFNLLDAVNRAMRGGNNAKVISIIAEWVGENLEHRETLLQALVNDYTIEDEPEDQLEEKIYGACKSFYERAVEGARDEVVRSLVKHITEIVNESKAT